MEKILDELRESLRKEEIKSQNYIQGYSDAIGEANITLLHIKSRSGGGSDRAVSFIANNC